MKYLKVFTDFAKDLEPLSDTEVGRLFRAMLQYAEEETVPDLKGNERFVWASAKRNIDNQRENYKKTCEKNKMIATKRYQTSPQTTTGNDW